MIIFRYHLFPQRSFSLSGSGRFIGLVSTSEEQQLYAELISHVFRPIDRRRTVSITLWYYMLGRTIKHLMVKIKGKVTWLFRGTESDRWKMIHLKFNISTRFKVKKYLSSSLFYC